MTRLMLRWAIVACATSIPAVSGDDGVPPRLSPASGASLSSCTELAAVFRFPRTTVLSVEPVASGLLSWGGRPIGAHCLVKGEMHRRTSPQDGKTYAIGFEMRLPNAWNGRFFYQANGGMDGRVETPSGAGARRRPPRSSRVSPSSARTPATPAPMTRASASTIRRAWTPIDAMLASVAATSGTYRESSLSFMLPVQPTDLAALKGRGAKVIVYHGVSDAIFSIDDTTSWYEALRARSGGDASDFARFFRVPGMAHCAGGPSTDQFDLLTALVDWVENGRAPDRALAYARGAGNAVGANRDVPSNWSPARSRPLCPYPRVTRLLPAATDLESAGSFGCE